MNQNELTEFSDISMQNAWRSKFWKICLVITFIITFSEAMTLELVKMTFVAPNTDAFTFIFRVFLLPTLINGASLVASRILINSARLSDRTKNYVITFQLWFLCTIVECFHSYCPPIFCAGCVSIFMSQLFGDKKLTRITFIASIFSIILGNISAYFDGILPDSIFCYDSSILINSIIAAVVTLCAYLASGVITQYNEERTKFIYESCEKQNELSEKMKRDPMTSLFNKKIFFELLTSCSEEADNTGKSLQLAIIDLDDFKSINDTYGHANGDTVLLFLAQLLRQYTQSGGYPSRYGGEEFAIIFPDTSMKDAVEITELIRMEFRAHKFDFLANEHITLSCGIAEYTCNGTVAELFQQADQALYAAKKSGKNRTITYKAN